MKLVYIIMEIKFRSQTCVRHMHSYSSSYNNSYNIMFDTPFSVHILASKMTFEACLAYNSKSMEGIKMKLKLCNFE